ncbi:MULTISPECIES: helix-turn-helix transcriptional regulator [Enterobacter]|uniref:Helix-turn-helix domain-containing protein n=1 Tax=Enterobacter cloacae TaxID=550 RepID=A0AA42QZT4_ENTCL|nr:MULTISPECIES: helix-turn-helix transcriptional regulator [Enterobacter]HAS0830657.1 helix-turn-helix transcriptional regulator [Enterobacter cloacae subsp. cloacae]EKY1501718.1 helix-turn-helix transcriptional regulator [Enterobacter cloacae]MDH0437962.1 helix-turn-helix domain-containing protein [Enterobacter cloacae]MDH1478947.1 helix-turn-helix domain-containing protein [Enterobacter cloacae]NWJ78290.1 helix-turn-helix transcriptional regulator [Enterobacter sp. SECR19-1250]
MKISNKSESELLQTLARVRSVNEKRRHDEDGDPDKSSVVKRQRVSSGLTRISTLHRQAVLHAAIRDILLGKITQGEALKRLRVEVLGMKQDEYAKLVSVSRKTLSDVENGRGNYSADIINKIFKPFGLQTGLVPISKSLIASLFT